MIAVNITALTEFTKLALIKMKQQGSGHIVNIASTAAFQPGPFMSVYFATKAYVLSLTESIAAETKNSKIKVQAMCPGPVKTEFQQKSKSSALKMMKSSRSATPEMTAKFIVKKLDSNDVVLIRGIQNNLLSLLSKFMPRTATRVVMHGVMKS